MRKEGFFKLVSLLGLGIRLVLAPFTMHEVDTNVLKFACRSYYESHDLALFSNWSNPPLLYYLVLFSYSLYYLLHYRLGMPDVYMFNHAAASIELLFIKLPFIIADLLIYILLNRSLQLMSLEEKKSLAISSFYLLNPYTIVISSVWGQWSSLSVFFIVSGFYLLLRFGFQTKVYLASIAFTASFLIKWLGLVPLFVLFSILLARGNYRQCAKNIGVAVGVTALSYLPFVTAGREERIWHVLFFRLFGGRTIISSHGISFFSSLPRLGIPTGKLSSMFVFLYSPFLVILFILIVYFCRKEEGTKCEKGREVSYDFRLQAVFTSLAMMGFLLLYFRVHIQLFLFLLILFPFLLFPNLEENIKTKLWALIRIIGLSGAIFVFSSQGLSYLLFSYTMYWQALHFFYLSIAVLLGGLLVACVIYSTYKVFREIHRFL